MYDWILEHSDSIGLSIDFISLIVSIFLTVIIYRLERRHEKEHELAEEKAQKLAVFEVAKVFLIDNDDEVDYNSFFTLLSKTAGGDSSPSKCGRYSNINGCS